MKAKTKLFDDLLPKKGIFDDLIVSYKERQREIALMMFWRKEHCLHCHANYEGSSYASEPLLQSVLEAPIVHFGKLYGWRFKAILYTPVRDFSCYDHLPRKVEYIESNLRRCRKCVHLPKVIFLPQEKVA